MSETFQTTLVSTTTSCSSIIHQIQDWESVGRSSSAAIPVGDISMYRLKKMPAQSTPMVHALQKKNTLLYNCG